MNKDEINFEERGEPGNLSKGPRVRLSALAISTLLAERDAERTHNKGPRHWQDWELGR